MHSRPRQPVSNFYFNNRECMQSSGIFGRPGWNIVNAADLSGIFINW